MNKMKRWIASALTLCMLLSFVLIGTANPAGAVTVAEKPANGTTTGQPFPSGTGGSTYFRIPALVTTGSGRVVAGIDARWNGTGDACGIDTMISYSDNDGADWTYTFANYLGDNNLSYIKNAATFIDPAIAVTGETLYMVVDLYVANYAINTADYRPLTGDPFTTDGYLKLKASGASTYDYYLKDGKIYGTDGAEVAGYTVDGHFNLYNNGTLESNLFYADTAYQAYATTFLYLTKSTDGGETWGEPKLLDVKDDSEYFYGICPGRGLVTESGRIIFVAYSFPTQYASLIFSDDGGETWTRSENVTTNFWSSETQVVELDDGTIRTFYRDGHSYLSYTDMIWNESAQNYVRDPDATEVATAAAKNGNNGCMLSAYEYSKPIDGKDAIFVATPSVAGSRSDGRIYVFLVNDDKSMELTYSYDITPGSEYYAYSCLTELENGDIALLWESGAAELTYSVVPVEEITARENNITLSFVDVALDKGESASYTDKTGDYSQDPLTGLDTNVATVTMTGVTEVTNSVSTLGDGSTVATEDCLFTFTESGDYYVISRDLGDGTTVYLNHFGTTNNNIPLTTSSNTVAVSAGANAGMFKLVSQNNDGSSNPSRTLHFHMEAATPYWNRCGSDTSEKCQEYLFRPAAEGEDTTSSNIPGFVQLTSEDQIVDGGQYLIAAKNDAGNWYVLNPTTASNHLDYVAQVVGQSSTSRTEITITGEGRGTTEVQIGNVVYTISVTEVLTQDVTLEVGETATFTDGTGYYVGADTSALDEGVATVAITGTVTATEKTLSQPVTSLVSGKQYIIVNTRAGRPVTNAPATAAAAAGAGSGLSLTGSKEAMADAAIWTAVGSGTAFTLQSTNGRYMDVGAGTASLSDTAVELSVEFGGTTWTIGKGTSYLNDFGGNGNCAAGWNNGATAKADAGSQWTIYEVQEIVTEGTTQITFTGVSVGETAVRIGDTIYNIIVKEESGEEPHEHVYDQKNTDEKYLATAATCEAAATYYYSCECGEKGTETFTHGDPLGHAYGAPVFTWNGYESATAAFTCANDATHVVTVDAVITSEEVEEGIRYTATVTFGDNTYTDTKIEQIDDTVTVEVEVAVGETKTIVDETGNYADAVDRTNLNETIATVTVTGTDGNAASISSAVTTLESGKMYVLYNNRAGAVLNNTQHSDTCQWGFTYTGLYLNGPANAATTEVWTIEGADGVYTVMDENGQYLNIGDHTASVGAVSELDLAYNSEGYWTISKNRYFLGDESEMGTLAAGWNSDNQSGWDASTDPGSKWTIYEYIPAAEASTTISITGVAEGVTYVTVGNTTYKITVSAHTHVYDQEVATEEYLATPADCENAATYYYSCSCGEKGTETFAHGEALGHDYGDPTFTWTDNTAKASFVCSRDASHVHEMDATVTSTTTEGDCLHKAVTTYVATVTFEEVTYTDTKIVEGNLGDHADENADGKCDVCGELLGVIRVAGAGRWQTALLVADEMKAALGDEKFDAIIIASGNDFADALAGSYLATVKNAPILLSYGGDNEKYAYLDNDNIEYVKDNLAQGGKVYILGGEKAVPTLYEDGLEGYDVVRLGGANRFETNILILEEAGIADGAEVLVCTSANFADSLSASATGKPILLVWNDSGALYGSQPEFLSELKEKGCTFTILGGENAVSAKLADEVGKYGEVDRLAGNTRMETSVLVAEKYFDAPETAVLAYAWNYPDGLCGGSLAYALKAPLILTMPKYEAAAVEYAAENDITVGYVLGGDGLIGDAEVRAIFAMAAEDQIVVKN